MTWFAPEDTAWTHASTRLILARLLAAWITFAFPLAATVVLATLVTSWMWIGAGAVVALALWVSVVIRWQVKAHAWAERDDDLIVKRGRFFRSVTVVPYGRMQYVEVDQGPLARLLKIARVQLHTASPGTDAHLAGVPVEEAARLRDRLTERGESQLAGL
ncbi:MAG: PH domain-containing protein [Demequina sp.]